AIEDSATFCLTSAITCLRAATGSDQGCGRQCSVTTSAACCPLRSSASWECKRFACEGATATRRKNGWMAISPAREEGTFYERPAGRLLRPSRLVLRAARAGRQRKQTPSHLRRDDRRTSASRKRLWRIARPFPPGGRAKKMRIK